MRSIALLILAAVSTSAYCAPEQSAGWPAYGGDPGGSRYSSLAQINAKNVSGLTVAWTFRTGELGQGVKDWRRSAFEATPILYQRHAVFDHQQHRRHRGERRQRATALAT